MATPHTSRPQVKGRAGGMIAVAAAAAFLATFNETFLNVAFTPIMQDFGVNVSTVQWLTTGYLLVAAVFVPVAIVLYHRYPTRSLFVVVVALMTIGSVLGALAPTFEVLLIARLLQAIGTGLLTPIGMNITIAVSPREKLGLNMGIMAAMTTLGPSLAIVLSGVILTVAPWTTLMWVFAALTLAVLLAGAIVLRSTTELGRPVVDVLSFILVAVGLVGILYGVSSAFEGSALYAGASGVAGLLALWLFVIRQRHVERPLLDLRPFSSAPFVFGVLMTMLGLIFVFAMNVVIPLFLQGALEMPPLVASLALAPGILLTVGMGPVAGRLFDQHGGRWSIPLGFLIMAVFVTLVGVAAGSSSVWMLGILYVPAVLATALVIGPAQTFALSHLDRETSPHGVTVVSTSFQIAGCAGTSLAVGVYGALATAQAEGGRTKSEALLSGFHGAVGVVVATSLLGIVLAVLAYRSVRSRTAASAQGPAHTVQSIMKSDVYALSSNQTVLDALQTFRERGISGAPILDSDGKLTGFLSDGDVLRYLSAAHPSSTSIYSYSIDADGDLDQAMSDLANLDVMRLATHDVVTIDAGAAISDAVAALSDARIRKVPVVKGEDSRPVGIVSRSAINGLAIDAYLSARGGRTQP